MRANLTGKTLKYLLLPGIVPRVGSLFFSGFGPVAYFLALLAVRSGIIPRGHPILRAPKLGIRDVLAVSATHISFKWSNCDKILIYAALVCAAVCLIGFVAVVVSFAVFATAQAAAVSSWFPDVFVTHNPEHDVAFMMLDRVLGVPGIFDSGIITNTAKFGPAPNALQMATQSLFGFFSWGLFIISTFIFLYFVIEIVWDITQTGQPIGETLANTWLPLRFILAFGLLIPISDGLNSAQYITLYTAKLGSSMATNAWGAFNLETAINPVGLDDKELIGVLGYQDLSNLLKGLMLIKACDRINYLAALGSTAMGGSGLGDGTDGSYYLDPFLVNNNQSIPLFNRYTTEGILGPFGNKYNPTPLGVVSGDANDPFARIMNFSGPGGIRLVIGYKNPNNAALYKEYPGGVLPVCGEVFIPISGYNGEALLAAEAYFYAVIYTLRNVSRNNVGLSSSELNSDLAVVREYTRTSSDYQRYMRKFREAHHNNRKCAYDNNGDGYESLVGDSKELGICTDPVPASYWSDYLSLASTLFLYDPYNVSYAFVTDTPNPVDQYSIGLATHSSMGLPDFMRIDVARMQYGWGGAGIWYNKLSEKNGSYVGAVGAIPVIKRMPMIMQKMQETRAKNVQHLGLGFCEQYSIEQGGNKPSNMPDERAQFTAELSRMLFATCKALFENDHILLEAYDSSGDVIFKPNNHKYPNPVEDGMASVFSELKLFDIRANDSVLPMTQLSTFGRLLVDKSILAMLGSMGAAAIGGLQHMAAASGDGKDMAAMNTIAEGFGQLSGALISFAIFGLTAGVILHYVVPMLPFIYFFFAVGRWVKTIFEALVGVPLWAMAHLRLEGPGLPGEAASSGYFLLLEIFIRPLVTVIALVGSFAIFNAMVLVLNSIFDLVTTNFGGSSVGLSGTGVALIDNARGIVDQFFYTVLYIILVYLIGTSSFKLIDIIPDNVLSRWLGIGAQSFGSSDNADDLIDQLTSQLPVMIKYYGRSLTEGVKEALYEPGHKMGAEAQQKYALEQARQASAASQQRGAQGQGGSPGPSDQPPPSRPPPQSAPPAAPRQEPPSQPRNLDTQQGRQPVVPPAAGGGTRPTPPAAGTTGGGPRRQSPTETPPNTGGNPPSGNPPKGNPTKNK